MKIRDILKNPFTVWLLWLIKKTTLERKHKKQNLQIGYMSNVVGCDFGRNNTIFDYVNIAETKLGDLSYVAENTNIYRTKMGKYCSIGPNVKCGLSAHPLDNVSSYPAFYTNIKYFQVSFVEKDEFDIYKDINIGNDVWVGSDVVIMGGLSIGDGAIIAAGAVVTKDVPPYAIVGGVPAKLIRYRFEPEDIQFLLDFKWWDKDIEWVRENHKLFSNIKLLRSSVNK